jgi:hypothetical protein
MEKLSNTSADLILLMDRMFDEMPLRSIRMMAGKDMPPQLVDGLLTALNGRLIKGLKMMGKK